MEVLLLNEGHRRFVETREGDGRLHPPADVAVVPDQGRWIDYSLALASHARETGAHIVVAGATRIGRDFMPRAAVLLDAGIASDVTGIKWDSEPVTFVRSPRSIMDLENT